MKYEISSKEELEQIAKDFILNIEPQKTHATVVGLYGDLGAGKTTFTQYIAKTLGVPDVVVSPTFVIEKIYELGRETTEHKFSHLTHIDAYRIESSSELLSLGWQKIISDPNNLILIEWPEKVEDIMPSHIKVQIKHLENEASREIDIVL